MKSPGIYLNVYLCFRNTTRLMQTILRSLHAAPHYFPTIKLTIDQHAKLQEFSWFYLYSLCLIYMVSRQSFTPYKFHRVFPNEANPQEILSSLLGVFAVISQEASAECKWGFYQGDSIWYSHSMCGSLRLYFP